VRLDFYISELLYSHDCVIVPGLGGFVAHERGAFLNPAQHTFAPPARKVAFNAGLRVSDGILAHAISRTRGITFNEAMDLIQTVVGDIVQRLVAGETVLIEKVGTLVYDKERNLQFEPEVNENYLASSFGLSLVHSPAIRRDEKKQPARVEKLKTANKEKSKSKSRWRLLELVPAAAVLALLAFNPRVTRDLNASLASFSPFSSLESPAEINVETAATYPVETNVANTVEPEAIIEAPVTTEITEPVAAEVAIADTTRVVNPVAVSSFTPEPGNYLVIGGCFREEANAEKFLKQATEAGFDAQLAGLTSGGLHIVSLYAGTDAAQAKKLLEEARITLEPGAWMKRVF
jgi:nucleoid DNA-binding protein